uniref:DUF695 domain-containing protein n=1 Tax=Caenorhabditis tropicalis TaxID=1561998 RepID=A0A1I7UE55_9PELO
MSEAELAFVPAEHHDRLQKATKEPVLGCSFPDRWLEHGREVYVTFYSDFDVKVVHMYLKEFHALAQITDKAKDLFPPHSYYVFSGNRDHKHFEFVTNTDVWDAIKRGRIYDFEYLTVRIERVEVHQSYIDGSME